MEYPAAYDANYTLEVLTSEINKNPANSLLARKHQYQSALLDNPSIGKVVLASGNRINGTTRLDWALVESPSTFSPNKPSSTSAFGGEIVNLSYQV